MKRLVDQYQGALMSFFVRRARNTWDAEELTQEVFCKILSHSKKAFSDYTEPYIFTIAWNVLRDRSRREKVRKRELHLPYEEALEQEDPLSLEQAVIGDERYRHFLKALKRLTPRAREVFLLSRYEGLSYTEIAEHCGLSVSAVEKHMAKSIRRLKELLKE